MLLHDDALARPRDTVAIGGSYVTAWMLAQAKPNSDAIAERNLTRQGFDTFRPLERQTLVRAGRFVTRTRAFFPGYLFIHHPAEYPPWSLVNSTYGVARLVKFGDRLAAVPEHIIGELRAACDQDGFIALATQFGPGREVEIQSGAFVNLIGRIERLSPNERALVLIDFMGTQARVDISAANLRCASDQNKRA